MTRDPRRYALAIVIVLMVAAAFIAYYASPTFGHWSNGHSGTWIFGVITGYALGYLTFRVTVRRKS